MRTLVAPRESYSVPARDRHADALASLRAMPTPVLLGELDEFRRDARRSCPPMRWLDGTTRTIMGRCVRDDAGGDGRMIILLDDGRAVLSTECQYHPLPEGE